jgi:tRNA(Ile)-lysidine synthase
MHTPRVAVATSGGRDSTALLHCVARQARLVGVEVWALHVHHGLMREADAWLAQVRTQARRWGVNFEACRLQGQPAAGESVEAWARVHRYRALAQMARGNGIELVLLAHHRQDQAETWLLQALRGAGHDGLAAMPRVSPREGITWARPWLQMPRLAIEAYVARYRLRHVEDASNADNRHARSRLRQRVWPALLRAFPQAEAALAGAAAHAQEASVLAAEVAGIDLAACGEGGGLHLERWLVLSPARRSNALRTWLRARLGVAPPQSLTHRLLAELPQVRSGRWPTPRGWLALHRGLLMLEPASAAHSEPAVPPQTADLSRPGRFVMPAWHGAWHVLAVQHGGVRPEHLQAVVVHARSGGERLRLAPGASARSLKKQFQAHGVPAWARHAPLLSHADGRLICVPGIGIDATFLAAPGQAQLGLEWRPD